VLNTTFPNPLRACCPALKQRRDDRTQLLRRIRSSPAYRNRLNRLRITALSGGDQALPNGLMFAVNYTLMAGRRTGFLNMHTTPSAIRRQPAAHRLVITALVDLPFSPERCSAATPRASWPPHRRLAVPARSARFSRAGRCRWTAAPSC
jgi:hypothetical protein